MDFVGLSFELCFDLLVFWLILVLRVRYVRRRGFCRGGFRKDMLRSEGKNKKC